MKMALKIGEIREKLASGLGDTLGSNNFIFKKSNSWFIRTDGQFEHIIYILIHSRSDHYAIEIYLFIRQKQVEKVYKRIIDNSTGITMGNTIDVIYNSPDGREIVHNLMEIILIEDADIEAAIETIEQYHIEIAEPYFKKYDSLQAIDEIFNKPPFEYNPANVGGMFDDRCMRGLIISKLTNNPNYQELIATYDEAIKRTMNQQSIDDYKKVKEYLNHNRI